jgi:hypothetical protein
MPEYDYKCKVCKQTITVVHSMLSIDELPDEIKEKITCNKNTCFQNLENEGVLFERVIHTPILKGSSGGQILSEKQLLKKKQQSKRLRSKRHFKKEVLPNLNETPKIMDHFNKKLKDI